MKDIQNLNAIVFDSIWDDIREDQDFSGQGDTARTTAFGELFEALAAIPNALSLGKDGIRLRMLCDVGSNPIKVLEGVGSPLDSSQRQRSAPTWRRRPLLRCRLQSLRRQPGQRFH